MVLTPAIKESQKGRRMQPRHVSPCGVTGCNLSRGISAVVTPRQVWGMKQLSVTDLTVVFDNCALD